MAYFVIHNDQQDGPLEAEQIKSRVADGALEWTDLCWREGWRQWRPIASVAALAPAEAFAQASDDSSSTMESEFRIEQARRKHASWSWVIVLAILLMLSTAGLVALSVFLAEANHRIEELEAAAKVRKDLESATAAKILEARAPVPGNEIKIWTTYLDHATARPIPVSRANVLLYRAESIGDALHTLQNGNSGPTGSLFSTIKEKLPAPWRETITDSDGLAVFQETPPGDYVLVVFTMKSTPEGESPYLWLARQKLDGKPHATLILTEENASGERAHLEMIVP